MKKIFSIFMMAMMMMSVVFAIEDSTDDLSGTIIGDPDYEATVDGMNLWNKIKLFFDPVDSASSSLTVIDGAICSTRPDISKPITASGSTYCLTNADHIGVAFQLFRTPPGEPAIFLGTKFLERGDRSCFNVVSGLEYKTDWYYCDNMAERTCKDSDGGADYYTKGKVTFQIEGSNPEVWEDKCLSSVRLIERICDQDKSPASPVRDCADGCLNGVCKGDPNSGSGGTVTISETDIDFKQIQVSNDGELTQGQQYTIQGTAYINGKCDDCVIESGITNYGTAFNIAESSTEKGACGDDKSVGVKFSAEDEYITFTLKDRADVDKNGNPLAGRYRVQLVATNGCYKDFPGGSGYKLFDSKTFTVTVEGVDEQEIITCYECDTSFNVKQDSCADVGMTDEPTSCSGGGDGDGDEPGLDSLTCYWCQGEEMVQGSEPGTTCPDGTETSPVDCEGNVAPPPVLPPIDDVIPCYYCVGDMMIEVFADTCEDGTSPEPITCGDEPPVDPNCNPSLSLVSDCGGDDCDDSVYFHNNPSECVDPGDDITGIDSMWYYIGGGVVGLLILGGIMFLGKGKKGKKK